MKASGERNRGGRLRWIAVKEQGRSGRTGPTLESVSRAIRRGGAGEEGHDNV